ncbi:MAG TPA: Nudix family hydrolase [Methylophilus sp.]|nr:Nudix family hydrolase [Methylophilus sp.]HQQ33624.1 Nudix family hydrolase [Methylophilus sp.]
MLKKVTHVAAGVLVKQSGEYLLASRPAGKPWADWWEFPGGKIEAGETPEHALTRELQEELGITPTHVLPWLQRIYNYPQIHDSPARTVHLHFHFVTDWQGELAPNEGQEFVWQEPGKLTVSPVLPANAPIMKALDLPAVYAISNVAEMGESAFLQALEKQLKQGLKLIQFREHLQSLHKIRLAGDVFSLVQSYGAKMLLNRDIELAKSLHLHGVHLPSAELMQLTHKPEGLMVAASCHNAGELAHAQRLGLDFVTLSPVLPTESHPNAPTLGWQGFKSLIQGLEIPVYALGGMTAEDLPIAWQTGARGVAMQRSAWE